MRSGPSRRSEARQATAGPEKIDDYYWRVEGGYLLLALQRVISQAFRTQRAVTSCGMDGAKGPSASIVVASARQARTRRSQS